MKQTSKILSIVALFAAGALTVSCNSLKEELEVSVPDTVQVKTFTSTVGFDATKALTSAGVKTFAADETIAVFYTNESSNLVKTTYTFTAGDLIDGGRRATITVSMDEPQANGAVKYIYPAAMANNDGSVNYSALNAQDGTLETLAANFDVATFDGNLTAEAALPASVNLSNQLAIGEFTIKNWGGDAITNSITSLTVENGGNSYTVSPSSLDTIYVAMQPVTTGDIVFTATDGTSNYCKTVSGKTLARNNLYPVSLKMNKVVSLAALESDYTALDGDILTGTRDGTYQISITDGATVTLKDVNITGKGEEYTGYAGITCLGDATILLSGTNSVKGGADEYGSGTGSWPGIFVPYDKTLTIDGTGSLDARPSGRNEWAPGIGSSIDDWCGNIIIQGGSVTATGGDYSAGIGSFDKSGCGNITITGSANVTATGGQRGAGIGCGREGYCGNITISTTGTVTAQGGREGAGIGTGYRGNCGNITISKGTVTATGEARAAGIGTGWPDGIGSSICGDITITTGVTSVTATRGSGGQCSIGKGEYGADCGFVTIGGTVYMEGGFFIVDEEIDGETYLTQSPLVYTP